jgi:hypothetical protein
MIKDPTVAEVLTEQAQRLRRRVQTRFATLPLPLATYVPSILSRINKDMWATWTFRVLCVILLCVSVAFIPLSSSYPPPSHSTDIQPQWVPPLPPPEEQPLVPFTEPSDGKGHLECEPYLANYTDRADHRCGVIIAKEQLICLSMSDAVFHYNSRQFWRTPIIYNTGPKKVLVSAALAQCPGRIEAIVYVPYSVIFFDANDEKHMVTIHEDTCLQILINALCGAPLCTKSTNTTRSPGRDQYTT